MRAVGFIVIFSVCVPVGAMAADAGAPISKSRLPGPSAVARKLVPVDAPPKPEPSTGKRPSKPRPAPVSGDTRARLEHLLKTAKAPPTDVELAATGRAVDEALIAIASDPAVELPVRTRAVGALAYTPTRTARTYLMSLVRGRDPAAPTKPASVASKDAGATPAKPVADAGQTPDKATTSAALVLLRRAAVTLGWIGGPLAPPALAPLLEHADPDVRADAAVGLALTRLPAAAEILRARLARESDARVRGHISRQLSVIDTALAAPATPSR